MIVRTFIALVFSLFLACNKQKQNTFCDKVIKEPKGFCDAKTCMVVFEDGTIGRAKRPIKLGKKVKAACPNEFRPTSKMSDPL